MAWVTDSPVGTQSVRVNRTQMHANNVYINTYLGGQSAFDNTSTTRDHFWNVSPTHDGRHRFIKSPAFTTDGSTPTDPVVGSSMDAVLYLKTTNSEGQWFTRPAVGNIYQISPNFKSGTFTSKPSFQTVTNVPNNVYGEMYMWREGDNSTSGQFAFFKSRGGVVTGFSYAARAESSGTDRVNIELANGASATDLNIKARLVSAPADQTWNYRITYRAM